MHQLHISLFVRFSVHVDGRRVPGIELQKVQELLGYLLLFRNQVHPRERLATLLWQDASPNQAKQYLRKTLWQLQNALSIETTLDTTQLLQVESEWVRLNVNPQLWLDIAEFERAFQAVQGVAGSELSEESIQNLDRAIKLYRGELLEGCYQDWCIYERERLQFVYLALLDKLMSYCETHHQFELGLNYGSLILRYDRAREYTHRQMMRLYHLAGDRTTALRQYERCVCALETELGVTPDEYTIALYEQICAGQLALRMHPPPAGSHTVAPLDEILAYLKDLQTTLERLQAQVQREIQQVEIAARTR